MNIFIGSSGQATDQLDVIAAIVEECTHTPIPWNRVPSPFPPGRFTLESLEEMVENENIGAAIFICTSDDLVWYRDPRGDQEIGTPRDNVIFEHGLFMGKLGRTRAIIVKFDDVKLPSDLAGYTFIDFSEGKQNRGKANLKDWLKKLPANAPQHNNNVLMRPLNIIHKAYTIDSRLHISDGLYKQICNIRMMNFASTLVINPDMADPTQAKADKTELSWAIKKIMNETEAMVEVILSEPNEYNLADLKTKIANKRPGSSEKTLCSALEKMHKNLSHDTIYAQRSNLEPRLFFFYLMKTSIPYAIFNVEFLNEASKYNHVKIDLYSAALKTENRRRSFIIWEVQDPENYKFFVDNFIDIRSNPDLCELQTCESLGKHVKRVEKLLAAKHSGG